MTTPPRDVADWATWTYIEPDDDPYGLKEAVRASAEEFINRNHTPTSAHPNAVNAVALNLPKMPIGKPSHEFKVGGPEAVKFGMAVFNVELSNGTQAVVDNAEFNLAGHLNVWGHFSRDDAQQDGTLSNSMPSAKNLGTFSRTFDGAGGVVTHDLLSINDELHGQGMATEFNAHAEEMYRAYGIREIRLEAASSVGGYAWAVAGYDFVEPLTSINRIYKQMKYLSGKDHFSELHAIGQTQLGTLDEGAPDVRIIEKLLTPEVRKEFGALVARIDAGGRVAPYEIAQVGRNHPAHPVETHIDDFGKFVRTPGRLTWAGKALLLGNEWHGVKRLDPLPKVTVNTPETKAADRARLKAIMNASRQ